MSWHLDMVLSSSKKEKSAVFVFCLVRIVYGARKTTKLAVQFGTHQKAQRSKRQPYHTQSYKSIHSRTFKPKTH